MTKLMTSLLVVASVFASAHAAQATEAEFLKSLQGNWSGKGTVKVRADSKPMNVTCTFASDTTDASLSLDGKCRALAVFSRAISADLKTTGGNYRGSYVGAGTGTAGLNGSRSGNSINLGIKWAKEVNGDRVAQMTIEKMGENGMRLTTTDQHPETGASIVTSQITLTR
ncbi:MAG: hypothetical protein Q8Q62_12800 [Mesorhizobium sp.]|nr:hypothetical protein [Mesorhizobium sp.]